MDHLDTRGTPRIREHYAPWRGVQVTDTTLRVGDLAYEISELRRLRERRGQPQPARGRAVWLVLAQAAIAGIGLVTLAGGQLPGAVLVGIGGAQALTSAGLLVVAWLRWPTPTELWATYRGEERMLVRDSDRYEFGKVRRAIQRAMVRRHLTQ